MERDREGLEQALRDIPALRDEFHRDARILGSGEALNDSLEKAGRVDVRRVRDARDHHLISAPDDVQIVGRHRECGRRVVVIRDGEDHLVEQVAIRRDVAQMQLVIEQIADDEVRAVERHRRIRPAQVGDAYAATVERAAVRGDARCVDAVRAAPCGEEQAVAVRERLAVVRIGAAREEQGWRRRRAIE
ncbi:MAG TPA: hypothetical protein VF608_07905 [Thermoanaerobaculia bacterium]